MDPTVRHMNRVQRTDKLLLNHVNSSNVRSKTQLSTQLEICLISIMDRRAEKINDRAEIGGERFSASTPVSPATIFLSLNGP